MLRHSLLSHLDECLLVWRSWAWKELNGTVLWEENVAEQHSIDVVLGDDGALELGKVKPFRIADSYSSALLPMALVISLTEC